MRVKSVDQKFKATRSLLSTLLIISFVSVDTLSFYPNAYAQYSKGPSEVADSHSQRASSTRVDALQNLTLPSELGSIEEIFVNENEPFVVLIQDAHAIGDAQASIQKIVEYLHQEYGIDLVALEGASDKLDTLLFRAYPEKDNLKKVFEEYVKSGELSGAAVNAVLGKEGIEYRGIENHALYEEGVIAFIQALNLQKTLLGFCYRVVIRIASAKTCRFKLKMTFLRILFGGEKCRYNRYCFVIGRTPKHLEICFGTDRHATQCLLCLGEQLLCSKSITFYQGARSVTCVFRYLADSACLEKHLLHNVILETVDKDYSQGNGGNN